MQHLRIATLPLAVYREIAAQLAQIQGVTVVLNPDQDSHFDYLRSQVRSFSIQIHNAETNAEQRVQDILKYYGDRFGPWESLLHP